MAMTSLNRWAADATASLPSTVVVRWYDTLSS
jgi:hypothetical protein